METYKNPKIKNFDVDLRMRDFEEANTRYGLQYRMNCFSLQSVQEILAMACEDIVPNGEYSDSECCLWSAMREVLRAENVISSKEG